jgi:hypothetical protein
MCSLYLFSPLEPGEPKRPKKTVGNFAQVSFGCMEVVFIDLIILGTMSGRRVQWRPTAESERTKLVPREDWNLAGSSLPLTRTRGDGRGRPNASLLARQRNLCESSSSSSSEGPEVEEEEEEEEEVVAPKKPPHTRVIVEVNQLEQLMAQFACKKCGSALDLGLRTVCLATNVSFSCGNEDCDFTFESDPPASTEVHAVDNDNFERSTDYAINVLWVLGFISMGDGSVEAGRLLGVLGLPNDTTMESRSFAIIEQRIGPKIRELCNDVLLANLEEEVRLTLLQSGPLDEVAFDLWKRSLTDKSIVIAKDSMPKIDGSFDMAWQQKGSGRRYDSQSGHGTIMGLLTRKVVGLDIKCKICNMCASFERSLSKNNTMGPM